MGICFLYENSTKNKILDESLYIEGSGIEIITEDKKSFNSSTEKIKFKLDPEKTCFIQVNAYEKNWTAKTKFSFNIESL